MDNTFMFWEAVVFARKDNQDLAILLLDFEKAFDRVDWSFVEGTMVKMGFSSKWINGVSSLYKSATSKVMLAGGKGPSFKLTRSIGQGCPMAPYLFFIFSKAMPSFLGDDATRFKGLRLPNTLNNLLDSEFVDDTTIYLEGRLENLLQRAFGDSLYWVWRKIKLK